MATKPKKMGRPPKAAEQKLLVVNQRLTVEDVGRLDALAARVGLTRSVVARLCLRRGLVEAERDPRALLGEDDVGKRRGARR